MTNIAKDSTIRCPSCGGRDVRPSHKQGLLDLINHQLGRSALRCRGCGRKFHKRLRPGDILPTRRSQGDEAEAPDNAG